MAYSTIEDLIKSSDEDTIVGLTSDNEEATLTDEDVQATINEAIESADAVIDMHVLARWPTLRDESPVPPWVNFASQKIALFNLYQGKGRVPPAVQSSFEYWSEYLLKVNNGDLTLVEDSAGTQQAEPDERIRTDGGYEDNDDLHASDQRVFTPDKLAKL